MIAETKVPTMEKAVKVILDMSEDTRIREIARQREKRLHDEASLMQGARDEGIAIGEARGIEIGEARGIEIGEARGIEIGEARGIEIGEARGIEIGEARGIEQTKLKAILNLIDTLNLTDKQAMDALKITEDEQEKYLKILKSKK